MDTYMYINVGMCVYRYIPPSIHPPHLTSPHLPPPRTPKMLFLLPLLSLLTPSLAQSFSGPGTIAVWNSSDWRVATPNDKVGCLSATGRFIPTSSSSTCGTFTPLPTYPYTLSSTQGNCTFRDKSQEQNTESHYGGGDYAFYCSKETVAEVYDGLYTIVSDIHIYIYTLHYVSFGT